MLIYESKFANKLDLLYRQTIQTENYGTQTVWVP